MLLRGRELVSITGAGGKTSLMLALGPRLSLRYRVVLTTTTRLGEGQVPVGMKLLVGNLDEVMAELSVYLEKPGCVAVARGIEDGKLVGFTPFEVDILHESGLADVVIAEADGSKGFPVKGYADHEPAIPSKTTCQFVVVGAELFSEPLDEKTVFRLPLFLSACGLKQGTRPGAQEIAAILESPRIFLKGSRGKPGMKRVLFVNKMDLLCGSDNRAIMEEALAKLCRYDAVCSGSLGWDANGCVGIGRRSFPANGAAEDAVALCEGDCPFDCHRLRPEGAV
mgnify:CR=1 FL=1